MDSLALNSIRAWPLAPLGRVKWSAGVLKRPGRPCYSAFISVGVRLILATAHAMTVVTTTTI